MTFVSPRRAVDMKTCPKCGEHQRNEEFSKGGNWCTTCKSAYKKRYAEENREAYNEAERKSTAKYEANNPKKVKMKTFVARAKKKGILVPEPCEVCGELKVEAHHDDYNKPFKVRWLCRLHHKRWHKKNGSGKNGDGPADSQWQELLIL